MASSLAQMAACVFRWHGLFFVCKFIWLERNTLWNAKC